MFALLILLSQKTRSKQKWVIQSDQDTQVCGNFLCVCAEGGWTPLHDPSLFFIFLGRGLSFSSLFLTCHVGMWHTFFGYASLLLFFDMPFEHVAYLLWVCIFYFFIFFFFIAHILNGQERKSHGMSWSFILWVDDSVCYVSGHVRDLNHESMTSL